MADILNVPTGRFYDAAAFFVEDTIKIFLLLLVIIFLVTFLRTFLPPERIKKFLTHRLPVVGNVVAALIGIVTPFCSCSAIPLFLGLVESGAPLGVAFSYLVAAPMVNEVAAILLLGLFGIKAALLYVGFGVLLAVITGVILGRLGLDHLLISQEGATAQARVGVPTMQERLHRAARYTKNLIKSIAPYIVVGVGIGAIVHGFLPEDLLARIAGTGNPFAVPVAVLLGVPLYSNAAGTVPVVQSLIGKGLPMGTALAFMMSVTALSVPEMIILKKVMRTKLLALYIAIVAVGIIALGYLFNIILAS